MLVTLHQTQADAFGFAQSQRQHDEQREHDGDFRIGGVGKKRHQLLPLLSGQPAVDLQDSPRREPDQGDQDQNTGN